jgi:hypothetical protein
VQTKTPSSKRPALNLIPSFLALVQPLGFAMRTPCFRSFVTVLSGWLFASRRTVTGMLVAAGVAGKRHHASFHRIFSAARWSLDELGLIVFGIVAALLPPGAIKLTLDDTLCCKRGLKMFGVGMHHDSKRSTRLHKVTSWGHSWVVLAVVVTLSCCPGRVFSLPILFRLYLNKSAAERARRTYKKRSALAVELLRRLCEAHPARRFHVFADSAYGGETVLGYLPRNCDLTSSILMKTRLHAPAPPRVPGRRGRRVRGSTASPRRTPGRSFERAGAPADQLFDLGSRARVGLVEHVARPGERQVEVFPEDHHEIDELADFALGSHPARLGPSDATPHALSERGFPERLRACREAAREVLDQATLEGERTLSEEGVYVSSLDPEHEVSSLHCGARGRQGRRDHLDAGRTFGFRGRGKSCRQSSTKQRKTPTRPSATPPRPRSWPLARTPRSRSSTSRRARRWRGRRRP